MGLTFYPSEFKYSFIPSGIHSLWLVNRIMEGDRFNRCQNTTFVDSSFNNNLFMRLRQIENKDLVVQMIETVSIELLKLGITRDVASQQLSRSVPITDMEKILLDFIQEEIELSHADSSDITSHDMDEILKVVTKSKFNLYPIFSTNGMVSNVHTGKFRLNVSRDDEGRCCIATDHTEEDNTRFVESIQKYTPFLGSRIRNV
jgi:hypothetical protein